jgi:CopG family nickel-responsive transcriptional regulator
MQRVTITFDDALMEELDAIMAARGYQNRSEAIRDLARAGIREAAEDDVGHKRECVAALVYTYDHAARQLSKRLTDAYHAHHELSLASLHVHLDEDTCLEVTVLRGKSSDVQHFGEHVIAERGVRHGKIVRMPVEPLPTMHRVAHSHGGGHHHHGEAVKKPARKAPRARTKQR